jgi:hypothetical protein
MTVIELDWIKIFDLCLAFTGRLLPLKLVRIHVWDTYIRKSRENLASDLEFCQWREKFPDFLTRKEPKKLVKLWVKDRYLMAFLKQKYIYSFKHSDWKDFQWYKKIKYLIPLKNNDFRRHQFDGKCFKSVTLLAMWETTFDNIGIINH